ncbi:hypothetical protein B0H13DRAFT_1864674 [Mycena leptocephala]|nr:hypothetical protein B0H13DRAFT_1864674 [Mycena leptocephala]
MHCIETLKINPAHFQAKRTRIERDTGKREKTIKKFVHPGAGRKAVQKIKILAAIVLDEDVIILTDFSRMSQVHILWETRLWKRFRGGPDRIVETDAALAGLDSWRAKVLKYQLRTPIIEELLDITGPAAGVGQHLANDLLFGLALHPATPSLTICSSDELHPNLSNTFIFHDVSDRNFMQSYVLMYRRCQVRMAAKDYNNYRSKGLLDPNHIIGTPYHGEWTMYTGKWKDVPAHMLKGAQNNMYYVIRATPPADWNAPTEEVFDFKDVTNAGFAITLGPASFSNRCRTSSTRTNFILWFMQGNLARKERTSGHPCKALSTHKAVDRILHIPQCRVKDRTIHTVNNVSPGSTSKPRLPMWAQDHAGRVDEAIMNTKVFRIGAMTSYGGKRE